MLGKDQLCFPKDFARIFVAPVDDGRGRVTWPALCLGLARVYRPTSFDGVLRHRPPKAPKSIAGIPEGLSAQMRVEVGSLARFGDGRKFLQGATVRNCANLQQHPDKLSLGLARSNPAAVVLASSCCPLRSSSCIGLCLPFSSLDVRAASGPSRCALCPRPHE